MIFEVPMVRDFETSRLELCRDNCSGKHGVLFSRSLGLRNEQEILPELFRIDQSCSVRLDGNPRQKEIAVRKSVSPRVKVRQPWTLRERSTGDTN